MSMACAASTRATRLRSAIASLKPSHGRQGNPAKRRVALAHLHLARAYRLTEIRYQFASGCDHSPAVGDRLLKAVARAMTDHCRSHLVARWDGGTKSVFEAFPVRDAGQWVVLPRRLEVCQFSTNLPCLRSAIASLKPSHGR
jgi:hypothetical protein